MPDLVVLQLCIFFVLSLFTCTCLTILCMGNSRCDKAILHTCDYHVTVTWLISLFPVFPKYSITRCFCRALLTDAYLDLLLPAPQSSSQPPSPDIDECLRIFKSVKDITRKTNSFMMDDIQVYNVWWYYVHVHVVTTEYIDIEHVQFIFI